jgi:hypothetical protein
VPLRVFFLSAVHMGDISSTTEKRSHVVLVQNEFEWTAIARTLTWDSYEKEKSESILRGKREMFHHLDRTRFKLILKTCHHFDTIAQNCIRFFQHMILKRMYEIHQLSDLLRLIILLWIHALKIPFFQSKNRLLISSCSCMYELSEIKEHFPKLWI